MRVPVGGTRITRRHRELINAVLKCDQISPGAVCREFESKFADRHGAKHGLFVSSGTDALRIAVLALKEMHGWNDGDGVIIPASTFVASANVVRQANLIPILVDVSMYDSLINLEAVERLLSTSKGGNIRVIMPVHLFGKVVDMDSLLPLIVKYKLKVIEDSCESAGVAEVRGDVACYSTYACHVMSTGVGGVALTNDKDVNALMWSYANHGRREPGKFQFDRLGYSARATELQAALGLAELEQLDKNLARRKEIARRLGEGLGACGSLVVQEDSPAHAWMMYPIMTRREGAGEKDRLCRGLERAGIETRDWISLVGQVDYDTSNLQVSRDFKAHGFYIGCYPGMSNEDIKHVVNTLRKLTNA